VAGSGDNPRNQTMTATTIERRGTPLLETPYRFDDGPNGEKVVRGTAAVFNKRSHDLGGFTEIIEPGAFERVLSQSPDVVALFNHDPDHLLARTASGTLELAVDSDGLNYSFTPPDTTLGRDLAVLLERGDIVGSSFAFVIAEDGQRWDESEDGKFTRYVTDVEALVDVSLVTSPAYPDSSVALRSLNQWREQNVVPVSMPADAIWRLTVGRSIARREQIRNENT
jgi:HK97 family phage prohead protease